MVQQMTDNFWQAEDGVHLMFKILTLKGGPDYRGRSKSLKTIKDSDSPTLFLLLFFHHTG